MEWVASGVHSLWGCILPYVRFRISLLNSGSWYSMQPLFARVVAGRRTHRVSAQCCELSDLYSTRACDVSRHLVVTTHSWVHTNLTAPKQCQRKLHKVQTYAVENADAGKHPDLCLGNSAFPCTQR